MKYVLMLFLALAIAACGGPEVKNPGSVTTREYDSAGKVVKETQERSDYAAYLDRAGGGSQVVKLTCPPTGCILSSLEIPLNPGGDVKIQAPQVPKSFATAFTEGIFSLGHDIIAQTPWVAGTVVLKKAFDVANSSVTTTNIDNSNRSTNSDSSNRSTTNNTTTTTTTTTNSNNQTRTCTSGPGGAGAGTTTGGAGGTTGPATC